MIKYSEKNNHLLMAKFGEKKHLILICRHLAFGHLPYNKLWE